MIDLKALLCHFPWFQKVFDLANTLPPDMPATWNSEPLPGDIIVGVVPHVLRPIYVADNILGKSIAQEIECHHKEHTTCSNTCPTRNEFAEMLEDRSILRYILQYIVQCSVNNNAYVGPAKILTDWRIASISIAEIIQIQDAIDQEADNMGAFESFFMDNVPPPSDEEKKKRGS